MKKLLTLHFIFFLIVSSYAQDDETETMNATDLTPFTGVDYVRVVFKKEKVLSPSNTFKAIIKSLADGTILWQGNVTPATAANEGGKHLAFTIKNLKPVLWTLNNPYLYEITLQQLSKGTLKNSLKERVGFRSFERKGGNLFLNGKPIFLRGIAINPPGRGIPTKLERSRDYALDYVKFMKSINVNIIRIPDAEEWFDVCDELGMMVFGGNYSGKVAGGEKVETQVKVGDETDGGFPGDYDKGVSWYQNEKLGSIAHHPSLMVYAMTNETPFAGKRAELWEKFLDYSYKKLKKWDETRVYIANAGYGYGKTGDITDIHRYWGWYYSSPFTFLHIRNEGEINPYPTKHQPITFTECVGNYTGPDGRYNLTPAHKNPSSQLAWTGHAAQEIQAQLADYHQSFTLRQVTETFRQLRTVNPDLSGVFPFTILFYNWNTITKFDDMKPKPVTDQVKISYQPVLLSWECWTPNAFAGSVIKPIAHIVNDANDFSDLKNAKLIYEIKDKAYQALFTDSTPLADIPYYTTAKKSIEIKLPANIISGKYQLSGRVVRNGEIVSQNFYNLFIADDNFDKAIPSNAANVVLYDKEGTTKQSLSKLGIKFTEVTSINNITQGKVLIIGENAADKNVADNAAGIKNFITSGGRVLCMRQDSAHLTIINSILVNPLSNNNVDIDDPVYPVSSKSPRNGYYVNPERPEHPVFAGITRDNLQVWSDYTNWDETKQGYPAIKPVTDGFTLQNKNDIASTAILGNYSSGLQGIALAEQFQGAGSIMLCGLDIANRSSVDPVAARLLLNMINYTNSTTHERYPLITSQIVWGEYETEKGVVTDLYSGLLVNSTPRVPKDYLGKGIVVTKEGYQLAGGNRSGFNTRPGIQYVANGRRPFGPYVQTFGGQPSPEKNTTEGTGKFWCKIPEGQNMATSIVWNPGDEPLVIRIKVNDLPEVSKTINAGDRATVETPVNNSNVNMTYTGDRRLVILETGFSTKD
jgi:beta-galactosidase